MSEPLTASVQVEIVTPKVPNFIRIEGRKSPLSIAEFDNDTLTMLASRWKDDLLNRAETLRNVERVAHDVSQYPRPSSWTDAAGEEFDPEIHSWSRTTETPAVTCEGLFKRRRGTAGRRNGALFRTTAKHHRPCGGV